MNDEHVALSIIVNAIQFEMQASGGQGQSGTVKDSLDVNDRMRIAGAILTALAEQGFQVTRSPSDSVDAEGKSTDRTGDRP